MNDIIIKKSDADIKKELTSIGFDSVYLDRAVNKYEGNTYKIFNLKPHEANILKQLCLSLGFDCAVHRDTITCGCDYTNAIIFASNSQYKKLCEKLQNQPFRLKELSSKLSDVLNSKLIPLRIRKSLFDWQRPYIMGILNVTPDSFSDGGMYFDRNKAVEHALNMSKSGADIIDIGAQSTRPNAEIISSDEEITRIIPVIQSIREINNDIVISVDTFNYETAKAAIEYGADIINDVSMLKDDKLFDFVSNNNIPLILTHSNSLPAVSNDFSSDECVETIYIELREKINKLLLGHMSKSHIIIDVGIGFGKSAETNFELLRRIGEFKSLRCPILVGLSRKSFITETFDINFDEADTVSALYSAMLSNVNIHRVHNVDLVNKYLKYGNKLIF